MYMLGLFIYVCPQKNSQLSKAHLEALVDFSTGICTLKYQVNRIGLEQDEEC